MPPLCTAGYGIANLNLTYFAGAIYLFSINSLFIALATFIMVRYLHFPLVKFEDPVKQRRVRRTISIVTVLMIIPSIYTAVVVIRENTFNVSAKQFVNDNKTLENSYIYDYKINHSGGASTLELSIAGEPLREGQKEMLYSSVEKFGIGRAYLTIKESATADALDEAGVVKSIFERSDLEIQKREEMLRKMESELNAIKSREIPYRQIAEEILAQHPGLTFFSIARGASVNLSDFNASDKIMVMATWKEPLSDSDIKKLESWLSVRLGEKNIIITQVN